MEKVYQFFSYSFYIRIFLEAYIFLLLTSFSELYHWNTSSTSKIISLLFAFVGAWICVTIISLSLINWYKFKNIEKTDNYIPLKEFFSGIRVGKFSSLYTTLLLSRRVFFVMLLILGQSLTSIALIVPMIIVQIAYLTNLIIVKPFKQKKDNIIEIVNELFYLLLVSLLSYYNAEDRWAGENATNPSEIRDFSSFRISNVTPAHPIPLESESTVAFYEETKLPSSQNIPRSLKDTTPTEFYWQHYNQFNGCKTKSS